MSRLADILEQPTARQLALADLQATIEAEERDESPQVIIADGQQGDVSQVKIGTEIHACEVEERCRQAKGMKKTCCGFIGAGTVGACQTRRQLLGGDNVPK